MAESNRESRGDHQEQTNGGSGLEAGEVFTQPPGASRRSIIWTAVDAVLAMAVLGMVVVVSLQIVFRTMGASLAWSDELTRFLFLWTIFLGMASGFRTGEHARITVVLRLLPQAARRFALHLYVVLGVLFFGVVAYYGATLVFSQYQSGQTFPTLQIGVYFVTLAIAVSALLAVVAHIQSVYFDPDVRRHLEGAKETLE